MDVLSVLAVLFGLAGGAGGAVGYYAKGRAEAVIALSAKENDLLKDANARLEKENAAAIAEGNRLKEENATLTKLAQGSPKIAALTTEIRELVRYLKNGNGKK